MIDEDKNIVMAEVDRPDAMTQIHEGAIYGFQGEQFLITRLEYEDRRAYAKRINPDYFTEVEVDTDVRVIHADAETTGPGYKLWRGEVGVKTIATVFKKIKFYTRENVGAGEIELPPEEMDTTAVWMLLDKPTALELGLTDPRNAGGWSGVGYLLQHLLPVYLGCSVGDVRKKTEIKSAEFECPSLFLIDNVPGGVGLAEKIFELWPTLMRSARELLDACACASTAARRASARPVTSERWAKAVARRILERCSDLSGS